jgi:hypothetical protein
MKKQLLVILLFLTIHRNCYSQDTTNQYKINYYNQKVVKYLDREKMLSNYYKIDKEGIKIYATPAHKVNDSVEFKIKWEQLQEFNACIREGKNAAYFSSKKHGSIQSSAIKGDKSASYNHLKPLSGLKIAIDPGHMAGDFETGKLEMKSLQL